MTSQEALAAVKKHHFWIICIIVVGLAVGCWQVANSNISAQYTSRKSTIDSKFKQVADLSSKKDPPNRSFAEGVQVKHEELKKLTLTAWNTLYDRQTKELIWPQISPRFDKVVPKLRPEEDIPADLREQYMNFIRDEIPNLYDIIEVRKLVTLKEDKKKKARPDGARGAAPGNMGLGGPGGAQGNQEWQGKVAWDIKHRDTLSSHYVWRRTPSTKQVRYAQEDLWIYRALLNIIANTNRGTDLHLFMPVKQVKSLDVGRDASVAINASLKASGQAAGPGTGQKPEIAPGAMPGAASDPKAGDKALDDMRFVNDKCVPIPGGDKLPYAEFKMIPVRFSLIINQMKISDLLVHCANSPLPVEIRRWRVNPTGDGGVIRTEAASGGNTPGKMPDAAPGGGQRPAANRPAVGGPGGAMGMVGGGNTKRAGNEVEIGPDDVEVEVIGMVYLFNEPNITLLGKGGEGQPGAGGTPPPPAGGQVPPGNVPAVPQNQPETKPEDPASQPAVDQPQNPAADSKKDPPADDAPDAGEKHAPGEGEPEQPADAEEAMEGDPGDAPEEADAPPDEPAADQ